MEGSYKYMLKQVTFVTIIISFFLISIGILFLKHNYIFSLFMGTSLSIVNLLLNAVTVNFALSYLKKNTSLIVFLSYSIRISIIAFVGLALAFIDKFNVIYYLLGYFIHFIALIIYGLQMQRKERK